MCNDLISRKALIEEIQSFRCSLTGLRSEKGMLSLVNDQYRKSILQIIEDQPRVGEWIPVEERLPEVPEGTEDEDCPEFNVTVDGSVESTTLRYSWDGTWFDDSGNLYNVIAWMPLPESYKGD